MEILLVDDERLARACTQSMLEEILSGVEVRFHHASTAAQALEWLEDRGAPDLAIVDYKMPKCSGLELVERAGPCCPGTVWVLLSGYDLADERSRIEAASKPRASALRFPSRQVWRNFPPSCHISGEMEARCHDGTDCG